MNRVSIVFIGFLAFVVLILGFNYFLTRQKINDCYRFLSAEDFNRAVEAGKSASRSFFSKSDSLKCLATAYRLKGELNLALDTLREAEKHANSEEYLMVVYQQIGYILSIKGDYDSALFYLTRALNLAKRLKDKSYEGIILGSIARAHARKQNLSEAIKYAGKAIKLMDDKNQSFLLYQLAFVYGETKDYQKAIKYLQQNIEIGEKNGYYRSVAKV